MWESLFPGRKLALDYTPTVTRSDDPNPYPTAQMSEGERTALYLITRLLSSTANIIVVDEPEIHFHPLLARHFWNALEVYKADALFVYVTHDIPFALSRNRAVLYVVRSHGTFDKIDDGNIPADSINTILGAASFSITATRLIFCEGVMDGMEHRFFRAWYSDANTAVIPVGGCFNVRQCVDVFNANHATKNVAALGHIDRDDWSDNFLSAQSKIRPFPVNEIEGIVCFEPIFKALATYYGIAEVDARYAAFIAAARNSVSGFITNKHALNRAKLVLELKQRDMRNSVNPHQDLGIMRTGYLAGITSPIEADEILNNEIALLTASQSGSELLLKFPAKTYQGGFLPQMGVTAEKAFDDLCAALSKSDQDLVQDQAKLLLKSSITAALQNHFFPRTT